MAQMVLLTSQVLLASPALGVLGEALHPTFRFSWLLSLSPCQGTSPATSGHSLIPPLQQLSINTSLCLLIQFHSGLKPHSHLSLLLDKWKIMFGNIRKILLLAVGNYIEVGTGVGPRKATTVPSIFLRPVDLFKVNHTLGKTLRSWM